jgi:peptide/nickel transport system substrate-binding protein
MRRMLAGLVAAGFFLLSMPASADWQKETLNVDLPGEPATLDPHLQWDTDSYTVYRNIFDNLLTRNVAGEIVGQIATEWSYVTPTEIEFVIQEGVTFHDGSPLTAEDVAFSINRIIDPELRSAQLSQFNTIIEAEATDDGRVLVRTETPYPVLLAQLVKLSIVPKAHVESVDAETFNQQPIGSGPYRFASWQRGVAVTLDAFEGYWRGAPPFGRVVFNAVPDRATRIANLRTGRTDIIRGLNPDDATALEHESGLKVLATPTERVGYMFLNALAGPTADVRIRRAIAHSIDRELLVEALLAGYGEPVDIVLTPASFGYIEEIEGYPYDIERARELVSEAGAEGTELVFLTSPAYDPRIVQALQQMIQEAGLQVTLSSSDQPTFLKRRQGPAEDAGNISIGNWSCACQDADGVIFPLFRSGGIWSKYENPAYDEVVDAARATLDEAERLELYRQAFEILREDVPGLGLYQNYAIYAARAPLEWTPTPNEAFFAFEMEWKP